MTDYQIQANTRRCCVTGRELRPQERFYSVLLTEEGKLVRRDYSLEAWQGPPAGAFSFWSGRVPPPEDGKRRKIDDELLLDCFHRLEADKDERRLQFRYVVALLLMRSKRLKFEEARLEGNKEFLSLRCIKTRTVHRVYNPRLTEEQMVEVQDEVFKVLGWE